MNPFEFVIVIMGMMIVGQIIRTKQMAKYGYRPRKGRRGEDYVAIEDGENDRLREEVKLLKDRIQTLERIAVDKENSLANEIEMLRDRRD